MNIGSLGLQFAREEAVLIVSSSPIFLRIYYATDDEQLRLNVFYLVAATALCCVLEKAKLPVALKRNGSPGLFYGYAMVAALFLECAINQQSSFEAVEFLSTLSTEQTKFSIWLISYSCASWLFRNYLNTLGSCFQCIILLTLTGFFMHIVLNLPITVELTLLIIVSMVFVWMCSDYLPNCFTLGEVLLLYNLVATLMLNCKNFESYPQPAVIAIWVLFFVVLFLLSLIPACIVGFVSFWYFYSSGCLLLACLLIVLSESILPNAIQWTSVFLCSNWPNRQMLLLLWVTEIIASTMYVTCWRTNTGNSSTSERKFFHVFILVTYIPGILYDMPLLFLCSVGATCILMIVEAMRVLKIPPFAKMLNDRFAIFVDSQDSGSLILTPIYLLLGQSLPIWGVCFQNPALLTMHKTTVPISAYSGILSVGIGDTMASVIGSKYGKHKWLGSNKTVEGTVAAILAQFAFVIPLIKFHTSALFIITATISISLVEAFTSQIDNLILPIYMYFLLNVPIE